jgi:hypothetical protein
METKRLEHKYMDVTFGPHALGVDRKQRARQEVRIYEGGLHAGYKSYWYHHTWFTSRPLPASLVMAFSKSARLKGSTEDASAPDCF